MGNDERKKSGPEKLTEFERRWETRMGAFFSGERAVFRGKDLHKEFRNTHWMKLMIYGATGTLFSDNKIELVNSMFVYTSYPDSRIWNNRVAALAGAARSTCWAATGAAIAVSDAYIYGGRAILRAIEFLFYANQRLLDGDKLDDIVKKELKQKRSIGGFGRPIFKGDERIPHTMSRAKELDLADGQYLKLFFDIQDVLRKFRYPITMNFGGLSAALCADMGFSAKGYYRMTTFVFSAGMIPCYVDALDHKEGAFFPMRCDSLQYRGPEKRSWGR